MTYAVWHRSSPRVQPQSQQRRLNFCTKALQTLKKSLLTWRMAAALSHRNLAPRLLPSQPRLLASLPAVLPALCVQAARKHPRPSQQHVQTWKRKLLKRMSHLKHLTQEMRLSPMSPRCRWWSQLSTRSAAISAAKRRSAWAASHLLTTLMLKWMRSESRAATAAALRAVPGNVQKKSQRPSQRRRTGSCEPAVMTHATTLSQKLHLRLREKQTLRPSHPYQ